MCASGFISLHGFPYPVCDYLLAKFIIFCVMSGFAVCYYALASPGVDRAIMAWLCLAAVGFELLALLMALLYAAGAILVAVEVFSSVVLCGGFCLASPLIDRARARGALSDAGPFFSTVLLVTACVECGHLLLAGRAWRVGVEEDRGTTLPPSFAADDARVAGRVHLVLTVARAAISMA